MNPKQLHIWHQTSKRLKRESFELYRKILVHLVSDLPNDEVSQRLLGYIRGQRWDILLREADSLSEQMYSDMTTHFVMNQIAALVRKFPWEPDQVKTDPEAKAIETFLSSERKCARLNKKFHLYDNFRSPHESYLSKMRGVIRYIIGNTPNVNDIYDQCNFGAGASLGVHGNATHLAKKLLADEYTVSSDAILHSALAFSRNRNLADLFLPSSGPLGIQCLDPLAFAIRFRQKLNVVNYNKISFVPKTAVTHRAIAVEPLLNGFLQKGTDLYMRSRIKRFGIDLRDQKVNQQMARLGSLDDSENGFVTIDLSSASDSISIGLVRSLLPSDWFHFLSEIRSESYSINGKVFPYHKFCSMGNGFCFPLETLLFVACCFACGCGKAGTDFSVYGDDIIVRKKYALEVLWLLKVMGFKANKRKTFLQGPFRESCGADWFEGKDVRPYTLDYKLDSVENIFKALNLMRRNDNTTMFFSSIRSILLDSIPYQFRFIRPYPGNANTGIDNWGDEYLSSPHCRWIKPRQCWSWKELRLSAVRDKTYDSHALREFADVYALLNRSLTRDGLIEFTFRRKTRTTVALISHGGSTSTWVPSQF